MNSFFSRRTERRAARWARHGAIGAAVRASSHGWELKDKLNGDASGRPAALPETIRRAITAVRDVLNSMGEFPIPPKIEYKNIHSVVAAKGGTDITPLIGEGILMLHASFTTKTGVRDSFEVPVMVKEGAVIDPSVFIHNGQMSVIAPSSMRELVARGTFVKQPVMRDMFSAPLSHSDAQQLALSNRNVHHVRTNPGMFSTTGARQRLSAAMRGDAAFREAQLGEMPARASMGFEASPATRIGDRIVTIISWDPDRLTSMSDGNIKAAVRSFILELGSKKEWRDWGTVADVQVDDYGRDGWAEVSFKSSEISAPQMAPADFEETKNRSAAICPGQSEDHIAPAERDKEDQIHVGDKVSLLKNKLVRNRGGGTDTLSKGTSGKVVGDIFGDGLSLKIQFEGMGGDIPVPASHVRRAKLDTSSVLAEIDNLRNAGYSPIDVILTAKERYGSLGEAALKEAKAKGLLDW